MSAPRLSVTRHEALLLAAEALEHDERALLRLLRAEGEQQPEQVAADVLAQLRRVADQFLARDARPAPAAPPVKVRPRPVAAAPQRRPQPPRRRRGMLARLLG